MNKIGVLSLGLAMSLCGCFSVPLEAPYGQDVKILPAGTPVEVSKRYQKWYALWGLFPLTISDNPAEIIANERLTEARVYTEDSLEDSIAGFFYVLLFPTGIIVPQTIVIEGNRSPSVPHKQSVFK